MLRRPTLADGRRWIVDQFARRDEDIGTRPKPVIRQVHKNLLQMTPVERTRNLQHLRAYADLYYQGRHRENVPQEVRESLRKIEKRVERLNTVDAAREVVQKLGGPPSRETVAESLDRSERERSRGVVKQMPRAHAVAVGREQAAEMGMGM